MTSLSVHRQSTVVPRQIPSTAQAPTKEEKKLFTHNLVSSIRGPIFIHDNNSGVRTFRTKLKEIVSELKQNHITKERIIKFFDESNFDKNMCILIVVTKLYLRSIKNENSRERLIRSIVESFCSQLPPAFKKDAFKNLISCILTTSVDKFPDRFIDEVLLDDEIANIFCATSIISSKYRANNRALGSKDIIFIMYKQMRDILINTGININNNDQKTMQKYFKEISEKLLYNNIKYSPLTLCIVVVFIIYCFQDEIKNILLSYTTDKDAKSILYFIYGLVIASPFAYLFKKIVDKPKYFERILEISKNEENIKAVYLQHFLDKLDQIMSILSFRDEVTNLYEEINKEDENLTPKITASQDNVSHKQETDDSVEEKESAVGETDKKQFSQFEPQTNRSKLERNKVQSEGTLNRSYFVKNSLIGKLQIISEEIDRIKVLKAPKLESSLKVIYRYNDLEIFNKDNNVIQFSSVNQSSKSKIYCYLDINFLKLGISNLESEFRDAATKKARGHDAGIKKINDNRYELKIKSGPQRIFGFKADSLDDGRIYIFNTYDPKGLHTKKSN